MLKKTILLILVLSIPASALDLQLLIRGSGDVFWNEGWEDKFFFKTFTQEEWEDIQNGIIPDFNRTLRHEMILNPEIWLSSPISERFAFSLSLKYQHLKIELEDSIHFSWIRWQKGLRANLNFYSIGLRLELDGYVQPYIGGNIGYCHGSLKTSHILDPPDSTEYSVGINGNGGGIFYDLLGGINIHLEGIFSLFIEAGYRFTPDWNEFGIDDVHGDTDESIEWIYDNDRRLDRFRGWIISFGVQIEIL